MEQSPKREHCDTRPQRGTCRASPTRLSRISRDQTHSRARMHQSCAGHLDPRPLVGYTPRAVGGEIPGPNTGKRLTTPGRQGIRAWSRDLSRTRERHLHWDPLQRLLPTPSPVPSRGVAATAAEMAHSARGNSFRAWQLIPKNGCPLPAPPARDVLVAECAWRVQSINLHRRAPYGTVWHRLTACGNLWQLVA